MSEHDHIYMGLPWKAGGRTRAGLDCVGLACLFLEAEMGLNLRPPTSDCGADAAALLRGRNFDATALQRGDVIFFSLGGKVCHVGVWLGKGKLLHILQGFESRIENGLVLARRLGLQPVAAVRADEVELLAEALSDARLAGWVGVVLFVVSILLSLVSTLLMPKLARQGNKTGKYGFDGLVTQRSTEIPLPDILGTVTVAGNSPYTQLSDKNLTSTAANQRTNQVIILAGGPTAGIDLSDTGITINGLTYLDKFFKNSSLAKGFTLNPDQTKAEAVTGTINGETMVPSLSIYPGTAGISVPVDIRASYDRTFPIYGFAGCAYTVLRLIDSSKFPQLNLTARVQGRFTRAFDNTGLTVTGLGGDSIGPGDGVTRRFKTTFGPDLVAVSALTVNAGAWTELSASNQTGNVFFVNKTKGFIEFPDNIPGAFAILVSYTYYPRDFSVNPARHICYLLTETGRGMGFSAAMLDWQSFYDAWAYFDGFVDWQNADGIVTAKRFTTNYAVDFRKPVQEHLKVLLDACRSVLFLSNGKFVLKPIRDGASVFSFSQANILADSFTSELADRARRANRIKAFYHDAKTFNAETEVDREDVNDQLARAARAGNEGIVEENLKFPAVDSQAQAERLAEMILRTEVSSRWRVQLTTTVLGLAIQVGDVVDVTHSSQPAWSAKLFRVENLDQDPDGRIQVQLSEYFGGLEL